MINLSELICLNCFRDVYGLVYSNLSNEIEGLFEENPPQIKSVCGGCKKWFPLQKLGKLLKSPETEGLTFERWHSMMQKHFNK